MKLKFLLQDYKAILRPLWFTLLLQIFILVAFLAIPQGKDVLYCVIEDFSTLFKFHNLDFFADAKIFPFTSILFALFYWSIASEFCTRFTLTVADLSSQELAIERKHRRYYIAKAIPKILFFLPTTVLILAFINSFLSKRSEVWHTNTSYNLISLIVIVLVLIWLLRILYNVRYGKWRKLIFKPMLTYVEVMRLVGLSGLYDFHDRNTTEFSIRYKKFFLTYYMLLSIALICVILVIFMPTGAFEKIGASAFICMGFGSWTVFYFFIDFITKKGIYNIQLPFKTLLLILVLFMSYINNDHPLRTKKKTMAYARPGLEQYIEQWIAARPEMVQSDSVIEPIFIAAEGGALRTGCFSAMVLASLEDSFPGFKNRIFCYSSVSGGTIGVGLFNALSAVKVESGQYRKCVRSFFEYDFLAPVTAKLVFGEPINWVSPRNIPACDRAVFLEKGWEEAWKQLKLGGENFWANGFLENYAKHPNMTAHFVNTTEVEAGRRAIAAPISGYTKLFYNTLDLCGFVDSGDDIRYSTAMGLSARFPLISPAGSYSKSNKVKRHFVDGGYYENKGDATLVEVLKAFRTIKSKYKIKPIVIQLAFNAESSDDGKGISFCNEGQEIISAMYNTRLGRTVAANRELTAYLVEMGWGHRYKLLYPRNNTQLVPMNWVLSKNAMDLIDMQCRILIQDPFFAQFK